MVRRRPCAHRGSPGRGSSPYPWSSARLPQAELSPHLVAVPVRVLGPVVLDVVPRPDSSLCPCGDPRSGAGALVRVGLTDGGDRRIEFDLRSGEAEFGGVVSAEMLADSAFAAAKRSCASVIAMRSGASIKAVGVGPVPAPASAQCQGNRHQFSAVVGAGAGPAPIAPIAT